MTSSVAGVEPGRPRHDGSQTTGRGYRNLAAPEHALLRDAVISRFGSELDPIPA